MAIIIDVSFKIDFYDLRKDDMKSGEEECRVARLFYVRRDERTKG